MLEDETIRHVRYIYGLLDILGDLGGVTEVIMLLFGFLLYPISEHSFILQALRRLYRARTTDGSLFKEEAHHCQKKDNCHSKSKSLQNKEELERLKHRSIKISFKDSLLLYFSNWFSCTCFGSFWPKGKKMKL